jgi:glycosyltransferase involved in cell wall biosynthesis
VPSKSRSGFIGLDLLRDLPYSRRALHRLPEADITITNCFWLPIMMRKQKHWGFTNVHVQRVPKKQMRLYGHAARISTASSHLADLIRAELPRRRKEIVRFFTNPVDTEVFHPGEVPGNNRHICYTGRVHPEKGIEQLARAVGLLRKSDPQWKLLVVGHTDVGLGGGGEPYKQRIIEAAGSTDAVEFTGGIRDPKILADHIRSCRYYCYPSLARKGEACPVAPLEALAAGVPPIVSELDQFLDYIEPNVNGIVVPMEPKGSELRLAEAIRALDEDPDRYEQLRARAVESAQKFAYEAVADRYIEDFRYIMMESRASTP